MGSNYKDSRSFIGKTQIVLVLVGIIPFLLVIYLFVYEGLQISDTVALITALALFSVLSGYSLMRRSASHLVDLARETEYLKTGEVNKPIEITADEELNDIAENFNEMLERLYGVNKEIKEQSVQLMIYGRDLAHSYQQAKEDEQLRNRLLRYVGHNLMEKLINSNDDMLLENERREVTVLFADIRLFSTFSEKMEAEEVVIMLNQFFSLMVDIVFKYNGILDKFIGDSLMAVFGIISPDNGARDAISAALEMQRITTELMMTRQRQGKETFEIGIGINTGYAVVGNVGAYNRMDYTVIGDSVNTAARLEKMATGGEIIIGEQTYCQTEGTFNTEKRAAIYIKNKTTPIISYTVTQ